MIDKQNVTKILEGAFDPFECVVELNNYDHAIGFAIYLDENGRIVHEEQNISVLQNTHALKDMIASMRRKIELKGFHLHDWVFPE